MSLKRFLSVPVISVASLATFVYYVTVFIFLEDCLGLRSFSGSSNALIFSIFAFLCLLSFGVCVLSDPGHVPCSYAPDIEVNKVSEQERKRNGLHLRQCDKCGTLKPQRAHHCRACKKCVLRMDHHCLWINNCVGYGNYKSFFVLVLYASIASLYSTVIIFASALHKDWGFIDRGPSKIFYISCGLMILVLFLTLGTLFGWHIYLLTHNMTTIEYYEGVRATWLARKSGQSYHHPYNLGIYKNITSVLGPNMLTWLCPTGLIHSKKDELASLSRDNS